jgi:hypothetical protein
LTAWVIWVRATPTASSAASTLGLAATKSALAVLAIPVFIPVSTASLALARVPLAIARSIRAASIASGVPPALTSAWSTACPTVSSTTGSRNINASMM